MFVIDPGLLNAQEAEALHDLILGEKMQHDDGCDIRLNEYGQADVDYYRAKARRLRGELLAHWLHKAKARLVRLFCQPLFGCHDAAANH